MPVTRVFLKARTWSVEREARAPGSQPEADAPAPSTEHFEVADAMEGTGLCAAGWVKSWISPSSEKDTEPGRSEQALVPRGELQNPC